MLSSTSWSWTFRYQFLARAGRIILTLAFLLSSTLLIFADVVFLALRFLKTRVGQLVFSHDNYWNSFTFSISHIFAYHGHFPVAMNIRALREVGGGICIFREPFVFSEKKSTTLFPKLSDNWFTEGVFHPVVTYAQICHTLHKAYGTKSVVKV